MSKKCEKGCVCKRHKKAPVSEETRARLRAAQRCEPGCTCKRHDRIITEEHHANIVAANQARRGESHRCPPGCGCDRHKAYYRGGSKQGRIFSDQARQNIAEAAQKRERSAEEVRLLSEQMKAKHADVEWEVARIAALQLACTGVVCPEGCTCGNHSEQKRRKVSMARLGTTQSEETRAKIAATLRQMLLDGTWSPGVTRPASYSRGAVYVEMRSLWEVDFAEELDRHDVRWVYEPERFDLGWTTYLPDFYLPDRNLYVEVKGWLRRDAGQKMVDFQALGHHLVLVTYHPSERGLVNPVPQEVRLILGHQVKEFVQE